MVEVPPSAEVLGSHAGAADDLLQREARVEALYRRWAEVATHLNDWLQDTLIFVSERWPVLEGGVRYDVTTLNEVVLYDVHTARSGGLHAAATDALPRLQVGPYRQALAEDESRLRSRCERYLVSLNQLTEAVTAEEGGSFSNRFSFFTPAHVGESAAGLEAALVARADAFDVEAGRCERAHTAFLHFSELAADFAARLQSSVGELAGVPGESAEALLPACRELWRGGEALADSWVALQEQDERCAAAGVVGTRLALVRLACTPVSGYAAVKAQVELYLEQLELEASLHATFEGRASALAPWVAAAAQRFSPALPLPESLSAAEASWAELCLFLSDERPGRARELAALIELRAGCGAALAAHGRPAAQPLRHGELEAGWGAMEAGVQARAAGLSAALRRLRALGDAVQRFTSDALELLEWLTERAGGVARELQAGPPKSRNEARAVKALVSAYAAEWAERCADLAALRQRGCRILAHRYERSAAVVALFERLAEGMADASVDPNEQRLPPLEPAADADADLRLM